MKEITVFRDGIDSSQFDETVAIWLGISVEDMGQDLSRTDNPLSFSDGTKVDNMDTKQLLKWAFNQPKYDLTSYKCGVLQNILVMANQMCNYETYALCTVACENASSGSERSRANLQVFALFAAGSVFKAFYALVGPNF